jgi:dolichyl-phosphate beta-glucosyltransferase
MTNGGPSLVLVVPCYNEADRLRGDAFVAATATYPGLTLLFVNDGSRDGTLAVLQALADRMPGRAEILDLQPNGGKAEAVRRGVLAAFERGPDLIGYWDADLATPFDALHDFLEVFVARPHTEFTLGSRVKLLGRHIDRLESRHYIGRVMATAAAVALGLEVYDTQCGAKVFRASDRLRQVFSEPFRTKWIFDVELLGRYIDSNGKGGQADLAKRIYELPLRTWTDEPGSKVRFKDGIRAFADIGRVYLARRALR